MLVLQAVVPAAVSVIVAVTSLVCTLRISKKAHNIALQSMAYEAKRQAYTNYMMATYGIMDTEEKWEAAARAIYGIMLYAPEAITESANRLLMLINDAMIRLEELQKEQKNPLEDAVCSDYNAEFAHRAMELTFLLKKDITPKL